MCFLWVCEREREWVLKMCPNFCCWTDICSFFILNIQKSSIFCSWTGRQFDFSRYFKNYICLCDHSNLTFCIERDWIIKNLTFLEKMEVLKSLLHRYNMELGHYCKFVVQDNTNFEKIWSKWKICFSQQLVVCNKSRCDKLCGHNFSFYYFGQILQPRKYPTSFIHTYICID